MINLSIEDYTLLENWIKDLREHPELQGKIWLRNEDNTYCCLGRLLDISSLGKWQRNENNSFFEYTCKDIKFRASIYNNYVLPNLLSFSSNIVKDSDQIKKIEKYVFENTIPDIQGVLIGMNDNNATFSEIADFLEYLKDNCVKVFTE